MNKRKKNRDRICTFNRLDKNLLYKECDKVYGECEYCEHYSYKK